MPSPQETEQPDSFSDPLAIGELISLPEAAELTGFSRKSLWQLAANGRLKAKKSGSTWLTTIAAVDDYKKNRSLKNIPKKYRDRA